MANYDFTADGFFYRIFEGTKNVAIVRENYYSPKPYSGELRIPGTIDFNGETYKVTEIDQQVFSGCKEITQVYIPSGVTAIGCFAFSGCTGLTDVYIPDSLTEIVGWAFKDCIGLQKFHVSENNAAYCDIDGVLFNKDKTALVLYPNSKGAEYKVPEGVQTIGEDAFDACIDLTDVDIPNSVTTIERSAFYGCTGLTKMFIPDKVAQIYRLAFCGCRRLQSIHVSENNAAYCDIDGVLFSKDRETLVAYPSGLGNEYRIPDGVKSIGDSAFCGCKNLTKVHIPDSITEIGFSAFDGCAGLTDMKIPNSVNKIDTQAFMQCHGLTEVSIPDSVTEIGHQAFFSCDNLRSVFIGEQVREIGGNAFEDCRSLHEIVCKAKMPPHLGRDTFSRRDNFPPHNDEQLTLSVPADAVEAYRSDEVWGQLGDIVVL